MNVARHVTTFDATNTGLADAIPGSSLDDNSTLHPRQGVGSTQSAHAQHLVAPPVLASSHPRPAPGIASGEVLASEAFASRLGLTRPVAGSRVELIIGRLSVDAGADLDDMAIDQFGVESAAVDLGMDEDPVARVPADEAEVEQAPVEQAQVDEAPIEGAPIDDHGAATTAARVVDQEPDLADDFWTAAASEGSVPTRKVVYGARSSAHDQSGHRGWFRSVRRWRR